MSGPGPRLLNWGTIPSREYLSIVVSMEGMPLGVTSVDELHREMCRLRDAGGWSALSVLLERVGCGWRDPMVATVEAHRKAAAS